MEKKQDSKKLTLNKETLQQLKIKSNVKAGGTSRTNVDCMTTINHNEVQVG